MPQGPNADRLAANSIQNIADNDKGDANDDANDDDNEDDNDDDIEIDIPDDMKPKNPFELGTTKEKTFD